MKNLYIFSILYVFNFNFYMNGQYSQQEYNAVLQRDLVAITTSAVKFHGSFLEQTYIGASRLDGVETCPTHNSIRYNDLTISASNKVTKYRRYTNLAIDAECPAKSSSSVKITRPGGRTICKKFKNKIVTSIFVLSNGDFGFITDDKVTVWQVARKLKELQK
jgi:hypothetical protein